MQGLTTEIVYASATELASAIRQGKLTAAEVVDAHIARIEAHNPALNAVITLDVEGARQRAKEADAALARGEQWGPLHGVPFTLKDAHATAGMRTTVGFPPFADFVPHEDGTVAARLKEAGAILMGKSNVHIMLGDPLQSWNPLFGYTSNPWDVAYTPGGSSGGAAAAVAAGMTPFDVGTDMAGSIRIPAHFCGVFGLKPTEHRIGLTGVVPDPSASPRTVRLMSCVGPLARTVDDLALIYQVLAGPDGVDTDVPPMPVDAMQLVDLKGLRVAVAPTFPGLPVAGAVRHAVEAVAAQMAAQDAIVEDASLPARDVHADLAAAGELMGMMLGAAQPDAALPPATFAQYLSALHQRDHALLAWEQFLAEWDVLLCPVAMVAAFPHCEPGTPLAVDGVATTYWLGNAHTTLFNYTGQPALALPTPFHSDGMPVGVQLVTRRWHEARLLGIAKAASTLIGGFQRPPAPPIK